jgi:cytochrome c-type biogenesis protein CcmH
MVSQLARRLEKQPDDLEGWLMLGRSYAALEQFPLAIRAYQHADRLAQGRNPEALIGEAEALAMQNEAELDGRAGRLFEQALALAPTSGKALFFTAVAASRRGDLPLARERFTRLIELNPPENIRTGLTAQIKAIDDRLAGRAPAVAQGGPARAGAPTAPLAGQAANDAVIRVTVRLSPKLSGGVGAAPLFVLVRDREAPGPPLAAKRLDSHFPQAVELTPSDSMIAGRSFHKGQTVQVVARIARAGTPVAQSGDPYGALDYTVGTDGSRDLVIDQISP